MRVSAHWADAFLNVSFSDFYRAADTGYSNYTRSESGHWVRIKQI